MINKNMYKKLYEYWESGYVSAAYEMTLLYLDLNPNSVSVKIIQADILTSLNRYDEAKIILDSLHSSVKSEQLFQVFLQFGHFFKKNNNLEKSNSWYKQALLINQDNALSLVYIAENYLSQGDFVSAKKYFNKVIDLDNGLVDETLYNLGVIEKSLRKYSDALILFNRALEIDPGYKLAIKQKKDVILALELKRSTCT